MNSGAAGLLAAARQISGVPNQPRSSSRAKATKASATTGLASTSAPPTLTHPLIDPTV